MPKTVKSIESGMFFRRLPFVRLIRQIIQELSEPDIHVSSRAMDDIQDITETYLGSLIEDSKLAILHAGRETLRKEDIDLVRSISRRHRSMADDHPRPSRVRPHRIEDATTKKQKRLRDNEAAISVPGIQRAAIKAAIERVGEDVYPHCTVVVKSFLEQFLKDAIESAKYNRRYTIKEADVHDAADRNPSL